ncbi:uncharacterized protein LOC117318851 [Pecten maximus]|uniref:uncharacterized protein LOC117318851 n=1 Tax=Pecten maximus TaxID=6579 RepID=UPI001458C4BE|nr:uncharacterized protein LOC117318851 [Pecten maximus]
MEVPPDVKKNVRSVLLSKVGGVLVSEFGKDYKSLLQKPLQYKAMGFQTMTDFIKAMPDVVRLQFDDHAMAYKMFGIGDPNMYMCVSAKKAERGFGGVSSDPANVLSDMKSPSSISNGHDDNDRKINPNAKGLYSLCYPRNKEPKGFSEDEVLQKFSEFGDIGDVNIIPGLIFIRFEDKSSAIKCLNHYESRLEMRIADERRPKNVSQRVTPKESGDAHDTLIQKKSPKAPISSAYGDKIEVYIGNINQHVSKEQFDELLEPFSPIAIRMVKPKADPRKVFAFADFHVHQEAQAATAIRELDQMDWEGRKLNVRFAQPDKPTFEKNSLNNQRSKPSAGGDNNGNRSRKFQPAVEDEDEWGEEPDSSGQSKLTNGVAQQSLSSKMAALSVDVSKTSSPMSKHSPVISPQKLHPIISPIRSPEGPPIQRQLPKKTPSPEVATQKINQKPKKSNFDEMPPLEKINQHDEMPELEPINSRYSGMPSLERIPGKYSGMPNLEHIGSGQDGMPGLEMIGGGPHRMYSPYDKNRPVMLFIGNFVYYENEHDLANLFEAYGVQYVEIRNNNDRRKTTSAVVTVANMEMANRAMMELDQTYHRGRRLLVCMAKEDPAYEPASVFTAPQNLHNIKCTIGGSGVSHRNVTLGEESLCDMQRGRGRSFAKGGAQYRETSSSSSSSQDTKISETTIIKKTFNSLLMTYKIIMSKLGARRRDLAFNTSEEINVYVTSVYDEQHFWGQVLHDESTIAYLNTVMNDLQCMETRIGNTKGLGRCAAQIDDEWFRGWITAERPGFKVDVFFVDYGNTATMDKFKTSLTIPEVWEIKPMVRPFKIIGKTNTQGDQGFTLDLYPNITMDRRCKTVLIMTRTQLF